MGRPSHQFSEWTCSPHVRGDDLAVNGGYCTCPPGADMICNPYYAPDLCDGTCGVAAIMQRWAAEALAVRTAHGAGTYAPGLCSPHGTNVL